MSVYPPGPNDYCLGFRTMSRLASDTLGTYQQLHETYGDIVSFRTGPYRLFLFFHPAHVHEILTSHHRSLIRLPRVMQTFAQWNGQSVLIVEGDDWIRQRRLVQPAFQPRRMAGYGETMVALALDLRESLERAIDREGPLDVDIDRAMTRLTLQIIAKTMFDSELDGQFEEIAEAVAVLSRVAFREIQAFVRPPIWLPTAYNRRKKRALQTLDRIVWEFVQRRRREGGDHGDLLSMLLAAVDQESGGTRLSDRQVRDELMTMLLAGHDTTAAALDWLWYLLATHPAAAQRCRDELDAVLGERLPTTEDVPRLAYLQAAVKETLRLYPPAVALFLRQCTEPLQLGGYLIPRHSLVAFSSFITQRDPRWFASPEEFRPQRFLSPDDETIPAGAYFPFGIGPRTCIGQGFAMTEMVLVSATLLQTLQVGTVPQTPRPEMEVTMALRPKQRLHLRWQRRGDRAAAPARREAAG